MISNISKVVSFVALVYPAACLSEALPGTVTVDLAQLDLNDQIELNRQYVNTQIEAVNQAVVELTSVHGVDGVPGAFITAPVYPLLRAFSEIREARQQFVVSYATFLDQRVESLATGLSDKNLSAREQFLTSGSIFDNEPETVFPRPAPVVITLPIDVVTFPGFNGTISGFFGSSTN